MRRFRAPSVEGEGLIRLDAVVSHHLLRVTGIAPGEQVELFDGLGARRPAVMVGAEAGVACLRWAGAVEAEAERPEVYLLLGLSKPAAFDLSVRFATELGADHIWPVLAARSVARGDREDRWERVAEAALAQCGRSRGPRLAAPRAMQGAFAALPEGVRAFIACPEAPLIQAPETGPVALLIGPEGGWTESERALAEALGAAPVGLGPTVLRAETAVAAGLARLLR